MTTILALIGLLTVYGFWEYRFHLSRLQSIPIRIHVNGTRGKSSVTRLIAAGLRAGGRRVVAKTTGTKPRLILESGREVPIDRIGRPNIIEQIRVVRLAVERRPEFLVIECMAVQPHLQWVSEEKMIHSTCGVITNAREDHLDQMGPAVEDVAEALSNTIPRNGLFFTADHRWFSLFRRRAARKKSRAYLTDSKTVRPKDLKGFHYYEHAENVALALQVCGHFGVRRETALRGMWNTNPDPGALKAYRLRFQDKEIIFYNAFAANDRDSTLLIQRRLGLKNERRRPLMVVINNRGDRLQRAEQFGQMMAREMEAHTFFLVGDFTQATEEIALKRGLAPGRIVNLGHVPANVLFEAVLTRTEKNSNVLAVGNIGGLGEDIGQYFKNRGEAFGLGLVISLIFSESLGLAAGGMVVPGYIALSLHKPFLVLGTVIASLLTLWTLKFFTNYMLIYGRRRIVFTILLGFIFGWIAKSLFIFSLPDYRLELASIGYIIPGLIANWMERQGAVKTLCVMIVTAVLVRLLLMLLSGEALP
jgi:poly-gamma-glutamate synthase PgsB/CapB/poly-gamma-glutamate biosynthesis protein PgsC/CapC